MAVTIVSPDYVINQMKLHGCKYWILRDESGKSMISRQEKDISLEDSQGVLLDCFAGISGTVQIIIRDKDNIEMNRTKDKITGVFNYTVRCKSYNQTSPQNNMIGGNLELLLAQINQTHDARTELLLLKLKDEQKESITEKAAAKLIESDGFLLACTNLVNKLAGLSSPAQIAAPVQITDGQKDTLTLAGEVFSTIDKEAPGDMLKLANYCKNNPGTWNNFKETLKKSGIL